MITIQLPSGAFLRVEPTPAISARGQTELTLVKSLADWAVGESQRKDEAEAAWRTQRDFVAKQGALIQQVMTVLEAFHGSELSMSSVQPVLSLAEELMPRLKGKR